MVFEITNSWTRSSLFNVQKMMFNFWLRFKFLLTMSEARFSHKVVFFYRHGFRWTYLHSWGSKKKRPILFPRICSEKKVFEGRLQSSIFWVNFNLFETIGSNVCLEINLVLQLCVIGIVKWPLKNEIAKLSFYKIYAMIFFIDEGEDVTMISMKEKICPFLSEKWKGISSWKLKVHTMYWFSIPLN